MIGRYEAEVNGRKVVLEIFYDEFAENPRAWENLGKMVCWHRRYSLGDKHNIDHSQFSSWDEIEEYLVKKENACIVLPIYMYDHSGLTISTNYVYPYNDRWDAGQIGFIYCTREDIRKWFAVKRATERWRQEARKVLLQEVELYDYYLRGNVYGFKLFEDDTEIDSCYGFYGDNPKTNGILDYLSKEYRKAFEEVIV